jgi:hypothetical protein
MKTMIYKQLNLLLLSIIFLAPQIAFGQSGKLSRKEKKEVRKAQMELNFYQLDSLINSGRFLLKADYLRNNQGNLTPVVSTINFIKVENGEGILQTGSNSGLGYNGVGGVTARGPVGRWEVYSDKEKLTHTVTFSLLTNIGNYDVLMFIRADNKASATIKGLSSGWLVWDGEVYAPGASRVFRGQDTI